MSTRTFVVGQSYHDRRGERFYAYDDTRGVVSYYCFDDMIRVFCEEAELSLSDADALTIAVVTFKRERHAELLAEAFMQGDTYRCVSSLRAMTAERAAAMTALIMLRLPVGKCADFARVLTPPIICD